MGVRRAYFPATSTSRPGGGGGRRPAVDGDDLVLNTLRYWGLDAASGRTPERLAANSRWEYETLPVLGGEVDCCINAFTIATAHGWAPTSPESWLGSWSTAGRRRLELRVFEGSTVSSFHSTLTP